MLGYLRLLRLPNVFTALADILAGYAIACGCAAGCGALAQLCGISAALYLAGMAWNDIADCKEDALTRPGRPLPSGQVSLRGAAVCGSLLLAAGLGLAYARSSAAFTWALGLAGAILLYNFAAKKNLLAGPLVLGVCRCFNVLIGLSATPQSVAASSLLAPPLAPALAVGLYAAGLTAFSAQEEAGHKTRALLAGWIFSGAGLMLAACAVPEALAWLAWGPLVLVLACLSLRLRQQGTPAAAKSLVRAGVLGICFLDAGLILGFRGPAAGALALLCAALLPMSLIAAWWLAQKEA